MPLYDFKCQCGHVFEDRAAMTEKEAECPICRNKAARLFSARGQVVAIPRRFLNGISSADAK